MEQIINYRDIPTDKRIDILNALERIGFFPAYGGVRTMQQIMEKSVPGSGPQFYFVFRENELIGYNFLIGDTKKYKAFPWLAISNIFKRLYEDSVTGRISDERFTELSADYEAEQRELKERAAAIQAELSKAQEATVNAEKFMNVVRRHTSFEELTPTLLREFVEKIVVHECSYDENKTRRQDIEIYYSFVGKVDLPE